MQKIKQKNKSSLILWNNELNIFLYQETINNKNTYFCEIVKMW